MPVGQAARNMSSVTPALLRLSTLKFWSPKCLALVPSKSSQLIYKRDVNPCSDRILLNQPHLDSCRGKSRLRQPGLGGVKPPDHLVTVRLRHIDLLGTHRAADSSLGLLQNPVVLGNGTELLAEVSLRVKQSVAESIYLPHESLPQSSEYFYYKCSNIRVSLEVEMYNVEPQIRNIPT